MTAEELKIAATALPDMERVELTASLIELLGVPEHHVSDEEVRERKRELDSGEVSDISYEELVAGLELPKS